MSASDDKLRTAVERYELWALWGGIFVVAAVLAEVFLTLWPLKADGLQQSFEALATLVIGLGVAAEVYFGRKASNRQAELLRRSEKDVAQLAFDVGFMEETTAKANERAAMAELETARIKERLAPRSLSPGQQQAIAEKLAEFKGQRVWLLSSPSTSETEIFKRVIGAPLVQAGWEIVGSSSLPTPTFLFPTGVIVQWFIPDGVTEAGAPDSKAAHALAMALTEAGIAAIATPGPMQSMGAITVVINTKE